MLTRSLPSRACTWLQSATVLSGSYSNGVTTIKFRRALDTGDPDDKVLSSSDPASNIIWATNPTKPASLGRLRRQLHTVHTDHSAFIATHSIEERGATLLNVFSGDVVDPPPAASPDVSTAAPPAPPAPGHERSYDNCLIIDNARKWKLFWTYVPDANMMWMAMEKSGEQGWISIGFQDKAHVDKVNSNEMGQADYIVADGSGSSAWIRDYYLAQDENEEPDLDPQQDITDAIVTRALGKTVAEFSRKLKTGDSIVRDKVISGSSKVLWANTDR